MSFALDCKNEIMKKDGLDNKAVLMGMCISSSSLENNIIKFSSANKDIIDYYSKLFQKLYGIESLIKENERSSNIIKSYVCETKVTDDIIKELELLDFGSAKSKIENSELLQTSYLSGAFIAKGSVNDPNTTKYHFEISLSDSKNATFVLRIVNHFNLNAKIIKRRNRFVVYIKDAEAIVDFLRYIGATSSAFHYEDVRIERDFNNSINRLMNCEIANEQKTIEAANEQLKHINYLFYNYPLENLDPKLLTIMKARRDNPDASLVELMEILNTKYGDKISKPGLSHRFAKLKEIAVNYYKEHNGK